MKADEAIAWMTVEQEANKRRMSPESNNLKLLSYLLDLERRIEVLEAIARRLEKLLADGPEGCKMPGEPGREPHYDQDNANA